ncbi:MAG: YbhB/YbcL family Raf kinase inhibitor-like protein [Novosphingobium sp.]
MTQSIPSHPGLAVKKLGVTDLLGKGGFRLTSAAFEDGGELDPCFTADEEDAVAPPLEWNAPPSGAMELVLVVEDASSTGDDPLCHWLVWGLAAQQGKLMEGEVPPRVGKNSKRNSEWLLPEPPHDDDAHTYVFQLFAIDLPLTLMPGATHKDLLAAIEGRVVSAAVLTAAYAREEEDDGDWDDEGLDAEDAD